MASGTESQTRVWPARELADISAKLFADMQQKSAKTNGVMLGEWGTHTAAITVRSGDGNAELHREIADFFIVMEGEATLVTGGALVGGSEKSPGELRAPSIQGGEKRTLSAGDIVYIPPGIPHQLLVKASFKYYVIKARGASKSAPAGD